jgi:hypothetical protein
MEMDVLGQSLALRRGPLQYWPQRLLHIPTMCSYEKRPGNIYGLSDPVTEPSYATLSYTWARYLRDKSTAGSGIQIAGIDWETPDVEPVHFTAHGLFRVINTIREISRLDYLWIDIACINIERIPDDDLDTEISMQQDIFFDAAASFIWLSRTEHSYLSRIVNAVSDSSLLDDTKTTALLLLVMADPWFSSLWTLLEAAVRTDAIVLSADCRATMVDRDKIDQALRNATETIGFTSRTGDFISFKLKDSEDSEPTLPRRDNTRSAAISQYFSLRDLIRFVRLVLRSTALGDEADKLRKAADNSGLLSFEPFNLLSLYGSAQHRHEMKSGLRMKYIHNQIFGFDVQADTLPQFQEHFNVELIRRYPVLSQIFIRQTLLQTGSGWRLTAGCKIPDIQFFIAHASSYKCLFTLQARTTAQTGPTTEAFTVSFCGPTRSFSEMASQWLRYDTDTFLRLLGISFDQCIISQRDGSELEIRTSNLFPALYPGGYMLPDLSQKVSIARFLNCIGDLDVRVLALAAGSEILPGYGVAAGLIIVAQQRGTSDEIWQRVGLCFWAFKDTIVNGADTSSREGLNPVESVWEVTEGYSA